MYGQWNCNQTDCKATCEVLGHGLVRSFDGETFNIFSGHTGCAFRLVAFEAPVSAAQYTKVEEVRGGLPTIIGAVYHPIRASQN